MKIEDLIEEIYKSNVNNVSVTNHSVKHGNKDQSGDYSIITLDINGASHKFSNETGQWVKQ